MPDFISSHTNPLVKLIRALRQRKGRDETGLFLVEGIHHVGEAVEAVAHEAGDAALIVFAKSTVQQLPILSYDQDFAKMPEITAFSPLEWLQKGRKLLK